jgi:DNA-binding protein YbaB
MPESSAWQDITNADKAVTEAERAIRRIQEAQAEIAYVTGEGSSKDSLIHAVTDAEGGLVKVTLDPRAMRLDRTGIAEGVTTAVRRAQAHAKKQVQELTKETLKGMQPLDETFVNDRINQVARELDGFNGKTARKA